MRTGHRRAAAANATTIISGGNFHLIERPMTPIAGVMTINHLDVEPPEAMSVK